MMTRKRYILFPPCELCLLENTHQGTWGNFFTRMSCDSHTTFLCLMFKLLVISLHLKQIPTVRFNYLNDFSNFHCFACPFQPACPNHIMLTYLRQVERTLPDVSGCQRYPLL